MVVHLTNRILIHMRKLSFNPRRIEPFLMQNRTHHVAKAMPRDLPRVSKPGSLNQPLNRRWRYKLQPQPIK